MDQKDIEPNRLKEVLDIEGLTQTKFSKLTEDNAERISSGTINKICKQKFTASNRHRYIIVKVLNKYAGSEKYAVDDIFLKKSVTLQPNINKDEEN